MSLFVKILSKVMPLPKLTEYKKYLFIGPHPDDIEIGAGATACKLASMGKEIKFLICTDGRYGTEDISVNPEDLVQSRKAEAINAAKYIGVTDIQFLPFHDGGRYDRNALTVEIAKVICTFQPDIIFAPDPKVISELHMDHINAGEAASAAYIMSGTAIMMHEMGYAKSNLQGIAYYYTDKPNQYVATSKLFDKQFEAILLHKSQFDSGIMNENLKGLRLYLKLRSIRYGSKICKRSAEGFRVLGAINTHCSPESVDY